MEKKNDTAQSRKKLIAVIFLVLAAIIAVQCVTIGVQNGLNRKYKSLYSEALKTQQDMQKTINELTENTEENDTTER